MIKSYFKTAFRNFLRSKTFSLINILGLSIGISASLVIYQIVHYDFSFDKFENDRDQLYRIVSDMRFSGDLFHFSCVPDPMAAVVKNEVSGLKAIIPFHLPNFDVKVTLPSSSAVGNPSIFRKQSDIVFADQEYFRLLPYQWVAGSRQTALASPFAVVLTESRAKTYFPSLRPADMLGRPISYNDSVRATVAGVVRDLDQNSDFYFKEFISMSTITHSGFKYNYSFEDWGSINSSSQLLVQLAPATKVAQIELGLKMLMKKYQKDQQQDSKNSAVYRLQPFKDIHFNNVYGTFGNHEAHLPTLYGLLIVAAFLLLLGCINFINLTTAQASQRAKEIGIRKTMGSSKRQLQGQFLSETFLITLMATGLSLILTPLLLKVFSDFIPKDLHFNLLQQPHFLIFLAVLIVVVTLLSGSYPAMLLSRFNPVLVLKNQNYANSGKARKAWLRKTLTVSQFMIAQIFIMATFLVSRQIQYTLHKDLGFKKDAIVNFDLNFYDTTSAHRSLMVEKLKAIPEIAMISFGNSPPSSGSMWTSTMKYKDGKKELENTVQVKMADTNYFRLYHMNLLAGKNLAYSDTMNSVLINETYAHILGFRDLQKALGKFIEWDKKQLPIVGVIADFHQRSLHEKITPLIFCSEMKNMRNISVALRPQQADGKVWQNALAKIEKAWKEIYPEDEFQYSFLDDSIAKFYKSEQDMARLLKWATGLAILISCLGMLGLVIYTTSIRTKEIGIRKVLGASVTQIVAILSRDFIRLILIAFGIATPIAWWAMYQWLENFAYRAAISWWIFAVSGLLIVIIAMLTLSIQTIRAAVANPVRSLRSE